MLNIITVTYNNLVGLKQTIESLNSQIDKDFKLIVIDGNSNDGTKTYLETLKVPYEFSFISEKDKGIYDAMNKGIRNATGSHLWFLNGGDRCFDQQSTAIINSKIKSDIDSHHFFAVNLVGDQWTSIKNPCVALSSLIMQMPVCHQGLIATTVSLKKHLFNIENSIAADHEFLVQTMIERHRFYNHNQVIANFSLDGVSSTNIFLALRQQYQSSLLLTKAGVSPLTIHLHYVLRLTRATLGKAAKTFKIYSIIQKFRYSKLK